MRIPIFVTVICAAALPISTEEEPFQLQEVGFSDWWKKSPGSRRDPYAKLKITPTQKDNISYIVDTLAHNGLLSLWKKESDLKTRGKQVEGVHILKFLGTIYGDDKMRNELKQIRRSSVKWSNFSKGVKRSLNRTAEKKNLDEYIPGFCYRLNVDRSAVENKIKERRWDALLDYLLQNASPV